MYNARRPLARPSHRRALKRPSRCRPTSHRHHRIGDDVDASYCFARHDSRGPHPRTASSPPMLQISLPTSSPPFIPTVPPTCMLCTAARGTRWHTVTRWRTARSC